MRAIARALSFALLFVVASAAGSVRADEGDANKARQLALAAGDKIDEKKWDEAIDLVTRAEALYHAPTNLLLLAQAEEGKGQLAEAMSVYERLAAEPLPKGAPSAFLGAQREANQRLGKLVSRVPSMLVSVHGDAAGSARADVDGKAFDLGAGVAVRFDPGAHVVTVSAPGFVTATKNVELPERGGVVAVDVTLEREPPPPIATRAPPAAVEPTPPPPLVAKRSKVPAFVAFGVGAVGLGVGAITGAMSLAKVGTIKRECPTHHCDPSVQPDIDSAGALGTASTVAFLVGGVAAGAGVVLYVRAKPPASDASRASMDLFVGPTAAGVRGRF